MEDRRLYDFRLFVWKMRYAMNGVSGGVRQGLPPQIHMQAGTEVKNGGRDLVIPVPSRLRCFRFRLGWDLAMRQPAIQGRCQGLTRDRLTEKVIHADRLTSITILLHRIGRHRNDG